MSHSTVARRPSARALWVFDPRRDLLLFVATPLLIVPVFEAVRGAVSDEVLYGLVAAFGSTGHHLPGLLRAYGDRELFARFRLRFVLAPILLVALCVLFALADLEGLVFMTLVWGCWHGLSQVYGLGRIYDAKVGLFSRRTALLDKAVCLLWFGGGLIYSPGRANDLLSQAYACGVPAVAAGDVALFRSLWMGATALVTVAWLLEFAAARTRGPAPNPVKLWLFASSFGFWWFAMIPFDHAIVGVALFEIFHDVQYLAIVWVFNRKLADQGRGLGTWSRRLFQPRPALLALYVGLVLAYGAVDFVGVRLLAGDPLKVFAAIFLASGFLHFYYDSFIWNLRDASTRAGLDVAASAEPIRPGAGLPGWLAPVRNWSWFALPLGLLLLAQLGGTPSVVESRRAVASSLPENALARIRLAEALRDDAQLEAARAALEAALALRPGHPPAQALVGDVEAALGNLEAAVAAYEQVIGVVPEAHFNLARAHQRLGDAARAEHYYRRALAHEPRDFKSLSNLAVIRSEAGDRAGARAHLLRALEIAPGYLPARSNLGRVELELGRPQRAIPHYEAVLRAQPGHPAATRGLREARRALARRG